MTRDEIIRGVQGETIWWLNQRTIKISQSEHSTMEINPFLAPLISALHGFSTPMELAEFVMGGHFYIGHGTGFGKLIDEKFLPRVFGTRKLDANTRAAANMIDPCYDNIDHLVERADGTYLLSLKAGRWTIQLGQAVELNRSFECVIEAGQASRRSLLERSTAQPTVSQINIEYFVVLRLAPLMQ